MKSYSLKTKENYLQTYSKKPFVKVLFVVLIALVCLRFFAAPLGSVVSVIASPLAYIRTYIATSGAILPAYVRDRNELIQTIETLTNDLSSHSGDAATIERLTLENTELRSLLSTHGDTRILAGVIGRPPLSPYDIMYIDRGARDGIKENAIVYHAQDQVLGFVSTVFEKSALVTLFSTPRTEVTGYLFGPNVYVHGYGEGGGVIRLSVPQGINVSEGDIAVLPSVVPGVLGTVTSVISVPTQPEQHAYVTTHVPIQSLHYVSIQNEVIEPISFDEAQARVEALRDELFTIEVPLAAYTQSTATPLEASTTVATGTISTFE